MVECEVFYIDGPRWTSMGLDIPWVMALPIKGHQRAYAILHSSDMKVLGAVSKGMDLLGALSKTLSKAPQ